jgi:hypothetical protein
MQPRCQLCRARGDVEELQLVGELWWCLDEPGCNYRARLRLHMRKADALLHLEAERLGVPVSEISPSEPEIAGPPWRPVKLAFCRRDSSHFCPCVSPHLYRGDLAGAVAWESA